MNDPVPTCHSKSGTPRYSCLISGPHSDHDALTFSQAVQYLKNVFLWPMESNQGIVMKLPSDSLPRVDGNLSNWTTTIQLSPGTSLILINDDPNPFKYSSAGRQVSSPKVPYEPEDSYDDQIAEFFNVTATS